jgi:hypothetical protein
MTSHAAHHHDRAGAARSHVRQHRSSQRERPEHVQIEQRAQLAVRGLLDGADLGAAGVVDQDVDPAVALQDGGDCGVDRGTVGDVERDGVDQAG